MKYYTVEVSNTKDGINNRVLNNVGEDIVKAKSNFYTRAGQLLGSTLLVETCLVLQDGVGNQIEKVYLCDIKQEFADNGKAMVKKGFDKRIAKGKMAQEDADKILDKIQCGLNDQAVDPDLVVEAALEVMQLKKDCFKQLQDEIVKNENCIYASNTSSLSITEIGAGLSKPVIGMHFFNPAPVMKLVPMINEGIQVYSEGIASIEGIDTAMKLGCNHPMGPLELGDYIGLDIVLAIMDVIYKETGDSKYRACTLLRKMVRGKHLGVKTGIGFYDYSDGGKVAVDAK